MKRFCFLFVGCMVLLCGCSKNHTTNPATVTPTSWVDTRRNDGVPNTPTITSTPSATPIPVNSPTQTVTPEPTPTDAPELRPTDTPNPTPTGKPVLSATPTPSPMMTPTPLPKPRQSRTGGNVSGLYTISLGPTYRIYEKPNVQFQDSKKKKITSIDIEAVCKDWEDVLLNDLREAETQDDVVYYVVFRGAYLDNPTAAQWKKICDYLDKLEAEEARLHPTPTPTPTPTLSPDITPTEVPAETPTPTPQGGRDRNNPPEEVLVIKEDGSILMPPNLFSQNEDLDVHTEIKIQVPLPVFDPDDIPIYEG